MAGRVEDLPHELRRPRIALRDVALVPDAVAAIAGLRDFRIELLEENADEAERIIRAYQTLLGGTRDGGELWRELRAQSQLGVTGGTYREA